MEFKRIWLIVFILMGTFSVNAQENYFIYLQTENNQPFYARMDNKVISSTTTGYMIIPKLAEGKYDVTIGFPKNELGEERFTIEITNKSEGYLLKDFGEKKGWSLFNLQTLALLSPTTISNKALASSQNTVVKEDPFSKMLATVTKDSTLLRNNTPVEAAPKMPVKEEVKVEESLQETVLSIQPEKKNAEEITREVVKSEDVSVAKITTGSEIIYTPERKEVTKPVKILGVAGRDGSEMIYVDITTGSTDTITVFIPKEERSDAQVIKIDVKDEVVMPTKKEPEYTITPTVVTPVKEENKEVIHIDAKEETKAASAVMIKEETKKPTSQVFIIRDDSPKQKEDKKEGKSGSIIILPTASEKSINSDCKDVANKNDFLRIRKRMAAEKDNDAMVLAAKKVFKTKCFSTEQIRNLSYLFLSDEGRYMFFDAAYPYTSDMEKFPTLISQLKDEYYINRFEAMIQK